VTGRMSAMPLAAPLKRWAWVVVLLGGVGLYLVVLKRLEDTQDPTYVPPMVFLAGTITPATFVTLAVGLRGRWGSIGGTVLAAAAGLGALLAVAVTVKLPFDKLQQLSLPGTVAVALVEEALKLLVPALVLGIWRARREPLDGLVVGVSIGLGFAALETMAHAFTTLLGSQGDVGPVEQQLFLRGLIAPAAYAAWTGLACGALWRMTSDPRAATVLRFLGTFVAVVALHAVWDGLHRVAGYVIVGIVSVAWLVWELRTARSRARAIAG
jgi:RsiW-degrading membrane proteinase PrsW (M82 family)